jgi:hypothetical protein
MRKNLKFCFFALVLFTGILLLTDSCKKKEDPLEIGQTYAGGIIFYLDNTNLHGLVCAPTDQSTALAWWNGSYVTISGAYGSSIGTGKANTEAIVAAQGSGNYAAKLCNDLVLNGYSDWFLPSKSECFYMYTNLKLIRNIGNFAGTDAIYWSSTEATASLAYSQYGSDGYLPTGGYYKNSAYYVRAIRAF